ncbi:DUF2147 domain-containing protein [Silvibacterium acidisoli]|uniref:DUF2147 domain-containing protein n=1 Tax=Acidobacteriaceae bacterium ZG23-2 TaxID=2883246 RepID=UPI00406C418C
MLLSTERFAQCFCLLIVLTITCGAVAQSQMLGDWKEPGGGVVRVAPCQGGLCFRILMLSKDAPSKFDHENPDSAKRTRPLCGLMIGTGFRVVDASHAADGVLYDPRSGKTYHGSASLKDNELNLRGYIGISLLGRTEVWQRAPNNVAQCTLPK